MGARVSSHRQHYCRYKKFLEYRYRGGHQSQLLQSFQVDIGSVNIWQ